MSWPNNGIPWSERVSRRSDLLGFIKLDFRVLFAVSLIFFRASSMAEAFHYISHLSFGVHYSWKEMNIGMPDHNSIVAGSALVLILVYEYFMSKHDLLEALGRQPTAVRWSIYYLLAIILFTLGQFNSDSFIYLQF